MRPLWELNQQGGLLSVKDQAQTSSQYRIAEAKKNSASTLAFVMWLYDHWTALHVQSCNALIILGLNVNVDASIPAKRRFGKIVASPKNGRVSRRSAL